MEKNELENNNVQLNHDTEQQAKSGMEQGKQSGMAIAALVCGIISICSCGMLFIPGILGIVFACIAMKDKSRKQTMAKAGLVISIISFGLCFMVLIMIAIGSGETTTDQNTTASTEEAVEAIATTEETTTEEDKTKDSNDISEYYGKNISEFENASGISFEKDGDSYSDGNQFVDTDEDGNIIAIYMRINPTIEETFTFEGIGVNDSIDDAENKLKESGYTFEEGVYQKDGKGVTLLLTDEDEYLLNCESFDVYTGDYETSEITGYYPGDTAYGDTIETYVEYAYTEDSWGSNMVRVECEITNISDESITFNPRDYYQLDNNGVTINVNGTDYDYKEISSGYSFKATLSFTCPEGSNKDLSLMTMTADNLEFNLGSKPQSSEEMQGLAGEYSRFNGKSRIIISDNGDGTYDVQTFNTIGDETYIDKYTNVTLNENNIFYVNGDAGYLWEPDEYTIYSYDGTWDKINENQTPWVKE